MIHPLPANTLEPLPLPRINPNSPRSHPHRSHHSSKAPRQRPPPKPPKPPPLPPKKGSTVSTKYGNVSTDHVLFIASGAFHSAKPSDMLAELQVCGWGALGGLRVLGRKFEGGA